MKTRTWCFILGLFVLVILCCCNNSSDLDLSLDDNMLDLIENSENLYISKTMVLDDNNYDCFSSIQGMCNDGKYIYYYIYGKNQKWMKKYSIDDKKIILSKKIDLGHCGDMCFNSYSNSIICASSDSSLRIFELDQDLNLVTIYDLSKMFSVEIGGISYDAANNRYYILAGEKYFYPYGPHKKIYICDEKYNIIGEKEMDNDGGCNQSVEYFDGYLYICKSYDSTSQSISIYNFDFKFIRTVTIETKEIESLSFFTKNSFFIAECDNSYSGGYIYFGEFKTNN